MAARTADLVALTEDLVAVDSTNPSYPGAGAAAAGGETRAGDLLGRRCAAIGLEVRRTGPDPGRQNVIAISRGTGGGRSLLLNGHLDTVPPVDPPDLEHPRPKAGRAARRPARRPRRRGHEGPLAAGWAALAGLRDAGVRCAGDIELHGVVGEEAMEQEAGTSAVLRAGYVADAAINLEPTGATLATASPGYRSVAIAVAGRSTHHGNRPLAVRPGAGGDAVGVNALEQGVTVVRGLQALERRWAHEKLHPCFAVGASVDSTWIQAAGIPVVTFGPG